MEKIIEYFINRSFFVNFVTVLLIILGVFGFMNLRREDFPNVNFDELVVRVNFPGATAEDMEKLVSISVERELKEVNGIKELNVLSGPGFSVSNIKVEAGNDVNDVLTDVRAAVDRINDFPEDVEDPVFTKIEYKMKPIVTIALTGGSEKERKEFSKSLRDKLERSSGVSKIRLNGNREYILDVQVDPEKLNRYELSLSEIAAAIKDRNIDVSGGKIDLKEGSIVVRTFNETKTPDEVESIVLRSNDTGKQVLIGDIAKVKETFADDTIIYSFFGERASFLDILSKEGADTITVIDSVKEKAKSYLEEHGQGKYNIEFVDDSSYYIKRRLNVLGRNAIQGIILVFLALLAFLNFRVSVITLLGAPIAFTLSFLAMYMFGVSINLISMFGLILVLGMLVDDSIIVAENFYQHVERGLKPKDAAKIAAMETLGPVTGTVLTTMVAFGCLLFISGIMGKFLVSVPFVVIICLAASWLECFFILPSHLSDFVKPGVKAEKSNWYAPLQRGYRKVINFALKISPVTILFFLILFIGSLFIAKSMPFRLFPADEIRVSFLNLKGPKGSALLRTSEVVKEAVRITSDHFGKEKLLGIKGAAGVQILKQRSARNGDQYGALVLFFDTSKIGVKETNEKLDSLGELVEKEFPSYTASVEKVTGGPPQGLPLNIELAGDSLEDLDAAADELMKKVAEIDGVIAPDKDYEEGDLQYIIDVNEKEARRLGLSNTEVALEVRRAFEGVEASELRYSDEDVAILVRFDEKSRNDILTLDKIYIRNKMGSRILLNKVVKIRENRGLYVIRRKNRKRVVSVAADVDENKITSVKANQLAAPLAKEVIQKYPGMTFDLAGENEDTSQSMKDFAFAGAVALACILFILVSLFNSLALPLMVMAAIPLGLIGVIWIFWFLGLPISFMALMGIIGLIGVVVNDSIVLITFVDKKYRESGELFESVVEGCISRFRAVILTTFTTVAGLLPLAHAPGGDPFLKPMAISFAYGLIFSTTLTLIFVPCCYYVYFRSKAWAGKKFFKKSEA